MIFIASTVAQQLITALGRQKQSSFSTVLKSAGADDMLVLQDNNKYPVTEMFCTCYKYM